MNTQTDIAPDFGAIKAKQQATWGSGDYAKVGSTLQIVGETLCEAIDLRSNARVLDVAAGNGNATMAAARRFADVTSTDYVPGLLDASRRRAEAQGFDNVAYQVADAEALPFDDGTFDVVLSTFGVMFTPDQTKAASEMARVCAKGGTIAMANWTADGFIGQVFKTLGGHMPPPPGVKSPAIWGDEATLAAMFAGQVSDIRIEKKDFVFRYRSYGHFMDVFRTYYGPIHKAFLALGDKGAALEADMEALCQRFNRDPDGGFTLPSQYAEVIITK